MAQRAISCTSCIHLHSNGLFPNCRATFCGQSLKDVVTQMREGTVQSLDAPIIASPTTRCGNCATTATYAVSKRSAKTWCKELCLVDAPFRRIEHAAAAIASARCEISATLCLQDCLMVFSRATFCSELFDPTPIKHVFVTSPTYPTIPPSLLLEI